MGTYVYAVRRKFITATLSNGEEVELWFLKYLYKPSYARPAFNAPYQAVIARLENIWFKATEKPDYVVHVFEKPEEGDSVRKWPSNIVSCSDASGKILGEHIGYLKRQGKKWIVMPGYPAKQESINVARPESTIGSGVSAS